MAATNRLLVITTLLSTLFVACQPKSWVLRASVDEIIPGETAGVKLSCQTDNSATDNNVDIKSLTRIRIITVDTETTFVDYRVDLNKTSKSNDEVSVVGSASVVEDSFLEITWATASTNTAGVYSCEVSGYDTGLNFVSLKTRPVVIKEKSLTMNEVKKLIDLAMKDHANRLQNLEQENSDLKTLIANELHTLRQDIQKKEYDIRLEITEWKRQVGSDFVTNNKLAESVSELKNFTLDEIKTDNVLDESRRLQIESKIQETATACKANFSQLESSNEHLKSEFENQLQTMNQTHHRIIDRVDFQLANMTSRVSDIHVELQIITSRMTSECCSHMSTEEPTSTVTTLRPKPTDEDLDVSTKAVSVTSTKQPTTTDSDVIEWPRGSYTLPKPASGCPNPESSAADGRTLFNVISIHNAYEIGSQTHSWLYGFDLNSHITGRYRNAELCWQDGSTPYASKILWPKGSYCIGEYKDQCPNSFQNAYISFVFGKDTDSPVTVLMQYCCRTDGFANVPIKLPSGKPFYMYRLLQRCQEVVGMTAIHGSSLDIRGLEGEPSHSSVHPDFNGRHIQLCYYEPNK